MSNPFSMHLLPTPAHDWAWFFDIDGTLAPIAASPDAVHIDPAIQQLIHTIHTQSQGAVALISGRSIVDIDRLFPERPFAAAGQHGAERRHPNGTIERKVVDGRRLVLMRQALREVERRYAGLLLEDKGLSLALHYRLAPGLESLAHREVRELLLETGSGFLMQTGKCVVEILPAGNTKGTVVTQFMTEPPFRGRVPVFVGDDVTDEHAFAVVNQLGGISVKVGEGETQARYRLCDVGEVSDWLSRVGDLQNTHHVDAGDTL
ncbi:MAG: trehalose-phosphatase [Phycisphaerae bacterium]|nr:trehalose-phosphatase [Gemmatimonadaceae bacterium]